MSTAAERISDFRGARVRDPSEPRPKPIPITELRKRAAAASRKGAKSSPR